MSPAAFIDANVPIYASGRSHPSKEPCIRILRLIAEHPLSFVTDVEVLQELMHRYRSSERWTLGKEVLRGFGELMHDRIEPVLARDIDLATTLADHHPRVSSRDLVHAAVMERLGTDRIISADTDFDRLPGLTRLDPDRVQDWSDAVLAREDR
ncbi:MAG: type II toxin-antitoxin system VapC family toxin [Chloroflexi bacterium]|nr:type II toxin-antitoxin system VapC family toxin [Chloroflexota bacterium]